LHFKFTREKELGKEGRNKNWAGELVKKRRCKLNNKNEQSLYKTHFSQKKKNQREKIFSFH
jgi:hypothetical protein